MRPYGETTQERKRASGDATFSVENRSANRITNANAMLRRAISVRRNCLIGRPIRSRRIVTGWSAIICERTRSPLAWVG